MPGKVRHYFAGGNTAKGFHSLYESALQGLSRIFILKGGPGSGKSTLIKKISDELLNDGYDIQLLHCSFDHHSLDGVIVNDLQFAIVDGTAPHVLEPKLPGAVEEYVNLGEAWDSKTLAAFKDDIEKLNHEKAALVQKAYDAFAQALSIHDEWEKIYIANMDFVKANEVTEEILQLFLQDIALDKTSKVYHRFLGAATPRGPVDYILNLTEDMTKRYFIKGRPGSGKSTMLKKLAVAAEDRGFDVEIYHCGFDPNSLDMVIIPERGFAIFDSTAPHEYFPQRESDEIIDMYERAIAPGTDEKYAAELAEIKARYTMQMQEGTACLAAAKERHDEIERIYVSAMDYSKVEEIGKKIRSEIGQILV